MTSRRRPETGPDQLRRQLLRGAAATALGAASQSLVAGQAAAQILNIVPDAGTERIIPRGGGRGPTFTVGYIGLAPYSPLFVLAQEGWLEDAPLTLKLKPFLSDKKMVEALTSDNDEDKIDIAYCDAGPVIRAFAKGAQIQVIGACAVDSVSLVVRDPLASATDDTDPIGDLRRFNIETEQRLLFATLPKDTVPNLVSRLWAYKSPHLGADRVRIIGSDYVEVWRAMLTGGPLHGAIVPEPIATMVLERNNTARRLLDATQMLAGQPTGVVAARSSLIIGNREEMIELIRLHVRATRLLQNDPERATDHLIPYVGFGQVPPDVMHRALRSPSMRFESDPERIDSGMRSIVDYMLDTRRLEHRLGMHLLINPTLHSEAMRRG